MVVPILKWFAGNVAWKVVVSAGKFILKDPPKGKPRPHVLYDPVSKRMFHRQKDGSYTPAPDDVRRD